MTDEADPVVAEPVEPTGVAEEPVVAPKPESVPVPDAPLKPQEMPKWGWDRLHEESGKRQEERAARLKAEQEAQTYKEMLDRLQKRQAPDTHPSTPAPNQRAEIPQDLVRAEAAKLRLYEDTVAVRNAGMAQFKDFGDTLNILSSLGATSDDFVSDVLATTDRGQAHVLLDKLAKQPERLATLARMDSRARIAQLTRIAMEENSKPAVEPPPRAAAPAPSKAPAPKPEINPVAPSGDPNDLMDETISDAEWFRRYKAKNKVA